MRQLNLPIDGWTLDVGSAMGSGTQGIFVVVSVSIGSVGPASAEDLAASRVQDTSEMVAAITNAKHKQSDPDFAAIPRSRCSLERLTSHLLKDHPVLSCVVGNSGNAADVSHIWRFSHKRSFPDLLSVTSGQNGVFPSQ